MHISKIIFYIVFISIVAEKYKGSVGGVAKVGELASSAAKTAGNFSAEEELPEPKEAPDSAELTQDVIKANENFTGLIIRNFEEYRS